MERRIKFALLKQQWAVRDRKAALAGLESLIRSASNSWGASATASGRGGDRATSDAAVYLDCLLKLGEWKVATIEPGEQVDRNTRKEVTTHAVPI